MGKVKFGRRIKILATLLLGHKFFQMEEDVGLPLSCCLNWRSLVLHKAKIDQEQLIRMEIFFAIQAHRLQKRSVWQTRKTKYYKHKPQKLNKEISKEKMKKFEKLGGEKAKKCKKKSKKNYKIANKWKWSNNHTYHLHTSDPLFYIPSIYIWRNRLEFGRWAVTTTHNHCKIVLNGCQKVSR